MNSLWQIFCAPLLLGVVSAIGLVTALVADGWGDRSSWLLLSLPAGAGLYYWVRGEP